MRKALVTAYWQAMELRRCRHAVALHVRARRVAIAVVVAFGWLAPGQTVLAAGEYHIRSCAASSSKSTVAWRGSVAPGNNMEFGDWCVAGEESAWFDRSGSLWLQPLWLDGVSQHALPGRVAGLRVEAPTGARITRIEYDRTLTALWSTWSVQLQAIDGGVASELEKCKQTPGGGPDCGHIAPRGVKVASIVSGADALDLALHCDGVSPCPYGLSDEEPVAAFAMRSSIVTLEEYVPPSVTAPVLSQLSATGWVGADQSASATVGLAASDTLGVQRLELVRTEHDQNEIIATVANPHCVDWSVTPCAEPAAGGSEHHAKTVPVAALGLSDGVHSIRTKATDAAGNVSVSAPVQLQIDRVPPVASLIAGGVADASERTVTWEAPRHGSPLASGRLLLCSPGSAVPSGCASHALQQTGAALRTGTAGIELGPVGSQLDAYIELTDLAGNTGRSAAASLRREPPGEIAPGPDIGEPAPTTPRPPIVTPKPQASPRLRVDFRKRMTRSPFLVRGSVLPRSAKRITVTVTGRTKRGKVTRYRAARKPLKTGRFSVRAKIPRGHNPRRRLVVTITVTPAAGYRATTFKRTLK